MVTDKQTKRFISPNGYSICLGCQLRAEVGGLMEVELVPPISIRPVIFQIRRPLYLSGEPNGSGTDSTPARFRLKD